MRAAARTWRAALGAGLLIVGLTAGALTADPTGPAVPDQTSITIGPYVNNGGIARGTIRPATNDGAALGTATYAWSDLFLASGGVINWSAGDVTLTHSANALAFAGASSGYSFDSYAISPTMYGSVADNGDITIAGTLSATKTTSYVILQPTGGNVGIGTTGPDSNLEIEGTAIGLHLDSTSYVVLNIDRGANANDGLLSFRTANVTKADIGLDGNSTDFLHIGNDGFATKWMTFDTTTGNVGLGTTAPDKPLEINSATGLGLRLTYNDANGSAADYVDLTVGSNGGLTVTPNALAAAEATSALSVVQTWNTTGAPTAIFANVTNTASGAAALLMDLQASTVSQFSVSKAGNVTAAGTLAVTGASTLTGGITGGCTGTPTVATAGVATTCTGPEASPDALLAYIASLEQRLAMLEVAARIRPVASH